ncbi:ATP-binding protein [Vibrio cyclitrophicus]
MNSQPTFLGRVIAVSGASINVELTPNVSSGLIMIEGKTHRIGQVGSFVRVPQGYNSLFGIISETHDSQVAEQQLPRTEKRIIKVELVGEVVGIDFERGISQYPSISDEVHIVTETDLKTVYGHHDLGQIPIGRLSSSDSIEVSIDLDKLVSRHSAVLGSTGSGKSTSVASLLRSITTQHQPVLKMPSARIILFDLHGEYASALSDISEVFSVLPSENENKLNVPYWCVDPIQLIDFLCGTNESLKNQFIDMIINEKKIFLSNNPDIKFPPEKVTQYTPLPFNLKNIWYELSFINNVTWKEKTFKTPYYASKGDPNKLIPDTFTPPAAAGNAPFRGGNGTWKKNLDLMRARLLDCQYSFLLSPEDWELDTNYKLKKDVSDLLTYWLGHDKPITIIDLSGLPSERLDLLLGSILDILFEAALWGRNHKEGMRTTPLLLVMEEAHRYLSNETNGLAKGMVRRIAKEGRKFGVGTMLVSQRPSEVDETILSQCGTLFSLRISNSTDRGRVQSAMSDGLAGIIDSLPILRTGEAIVTGEAARLPMRFRFRIPRSEHFPDSHDPHITASWSQPRQKMDFSKMVNSWRLQDAVNKDKEAK